MDWFTLGLLLLTVMLNAGLAVGSLWGGIKLLTGKTESGQQKALMTLLGLALLALAAYCLHLLYQFYRFVHPR